MNGNQNRSSPCLESLGGSQIAELISSNVSPIYDIPGLVAIFFDGEMNIEGASFLFNVFGCIFIGLADLHRL